MSATESANGGNAGPSVSAATTPAGAGRPSSPTPAPVGLTGTASALVSWLTSGPFLHLAGLAAVATLMGIGTVSSDQGFPILTGLVGLGIKTAAS
jgi:hypothetical protein